MHAAIGKSHTGNFWHDETGATYGPLIEVDAQQSRHCVVF
jgi:hypothetical protein